MRRMAQWRFIVVVALVGVRMVLAGRITVIGLVRALMAGVTAGSRQRAEFGSADGGTDP